ncbi:hypothetical protein OSB04_011463 [Centaurea solstitialis]|uniref:Integrase catalytic domain-containing protein n=1 Tax=Centaurea solstitialis TaxID=347529 RepID=A0AA38WP53_9ASTR|nr:hypothetical protein OSB04_011463 [Centaurea solstitialis]
MADESDVMSVLSFSTSPEFSADLRVKFCHEVMKDIENQVGFYKNCGKYLIMQEIFSLKLEMGQSVKDHLMDMRRLFKSSDYMGEPRMDVANVHEEILEPASAELMATYWIDELGDLSCPECGSQDICRFNRRETLRNVRSNLQVGESTMLVAEAVLVRAWTKARLRLDDSGVGILATTPTNGLYVLNLQESNNEIYHISKRSKEIEDPTYLWHCRLRHINKKRIEQLQKGGLLGSFDFRPFNNCEYCLSGKMTKQPFYKNNERANDFRYGYVYLIRHKSEASEKFKEFNNEVQNQLDRKIKFLWLDRGGKYLSQEFDNHLMECGIVSQLTPPYTPQINVSFWGHALETAAHMMNRVPTKSVEKTPYEIWTGMKPKFSFLKIWGCEVYVKRTTSKKLKPKSDKCIFVGYPKTTVRYYFYNSSENKVFVARNGEFLEDKFLSLENTINDVDLQKVEEYTTLPLIELLTQQEHVETQPETVEEVQTQDLRRSTRIRQKADRYLGFLITQDHGDLNEPISYGDAVSGIAMLKSIKILMAISGYFNYEIWQMDVKTAFLNGKLTEDLYMLQPDGFVDPKNPNKVCKLLKSIYGLKQSSRSWNLHFDERIKEFGFSKSEFEPCVYTKFSGSIVTFLVLYVDDILLIGNDVPTLQGVKAWLGKCFQMKDLG